MTLKSRPLEPIGLSLSSIYNLDCAVNQQHHYASFYTSQFIEKLKERGSSTVMSSEYLSLCPEFRTRIEGLSAASILIEGTILNMVACGHHRMICTARADNSTSYLAQIAGYEIFQSDLEKRAFRCDLMHVDAKQRSSVDSVKQQRVKELANSIWERVTICHDAKLRMEFLREHSPASSVSSKAA
ncbi:hypothetical protein GW916_06950 [bacterium]|nr:hypothetical protein [bacterium]